jgi:menaquinone reductase, multiheme cytochrome c subunit
LTISASKSQHVFPPAANYLFPAALILVVGAATYLPVLVGLGASPQTLAVGYAPQQPVPFSHALHVGELGMDCLYCHTTVDNAAFAAVPSTQSCMNCHASISTDSPDLALVRESHATGKPIDWVKVHDLPDYVYFNHAAHVSQGIGCVTCHGRVDKMEVVHQAEPLSMAWCLDCHRTPERHLRPREEVTNMTFSALADTGRTQEELGAELRVRYGIHDQSYMTSCSTCHR